MRRPGPAYLDFMASTPVDPSVIDAMTDAMSHDCGNPHSDHAHGLQASKIVERSREALAALLGAGEDEILFTSGATEANNLAIKGVMSSAERRGNHLVVSSIEHKCVLEAARSLVKRGIEVTEVRPGSDGRVRAEAIAQALRPDTALVSVMHANNETGVIQPVREIAEICHRQGVLFHTDAAQTVGKIDVDFTYSLMAVDSSLSDAAVQCRFRFAPGLQRRRGFTSATASRHAHIFNHYKDFSKIGSPGRDALLLSIRMPSASRVAQASGPRE